MKVTVRFFASVREAADAEELTVELPAGATVKILFGKLSRDRRGLRELDEHTIAAVGEEQAEWGTVLHDGDEVAFYPPVSGG